ncbi:40S ribosomal protein S27-like [Hippopotamus amphibius kiboko]|uniref:40S ribosomal protein S27-like n=1 Tax=Hippopotamus amphibius kiboko TaxID=575201 RepID=UPI00259AE10B|nr:40S ribosomal protein S27-like [Hippopotamus amphibius kiboko]
MGMRTSSGAASALGPGFDPYMTLEPQPGNKYFANLLKWKSEPPHSLRPFFIYPHSVSLCMSLGAGYLFPPAPQRNIPLTENLLHPSPEEEKRKYKKKHLVQSPNSCFMDVKCPGCYKITPVFSHTQTVALCVGCSTVLCQPTGGKARLTERCSFRWKQH